MNEDNEDSDIPTAFQTSQGFPTPGGEKEFNFVEDDGPRYGYHVMVPRPVEHNFPKPNLPESPRTREALERAVPQYARYVLKEYDLNIERERLRFAVSGRFRRSLGKCGPDGYHRARVRISAHHYIKRGYTWERCKETIRHELAHAWQLRWLGYSSHGPTFLKKARELDCDGLGRYEGKREPKYIAYCQSCGAYFKRQRMCSAVRRPGGCGVCDTRFIDGDSPWKVFENTDWHKVME